MPEIRVQDEQGTVHVFPDGSTPEMISQVLHVKPPEAPMQAQPDEPVPPSFGQRLTASYNPNASEVTKTPVLNQTVRFLDAAGGAALGIPSFLAHMVTPNADQQQPQNPDAMMSMAQRMAAPIAQGMDDYADPRTRPTLKQAASVLPEALGQGVGTVGASEGLARSLPFLRGMVGKIPSKARAGANFQEVMGAAKNVPIDTAAPGNAALRLKEFASRGGRLPKVVSDFLRRATDPNQGPLTYEETRDFAQNAGKLSANERNALSPNVQRMVSQFARELNKANEGAATQVGKGAQYKSAMKEYRQASTVQEFQEFLKGQAGKLALRGAQAAGAGAAGAMGYEAYQQLKK